MFAQIGDDFMDNLYNRIHSLVLDKGMTDGSACDFCEWLSENAHQYEYYTFYECLEEIKSNPRLYDLYYHIREQAMVNSYAEINKVSARLTQQQ